MEMAGDGPTETPEAGEDIASGPREGAGDGVPSSAMTWGTAGHLAAFIWLVGIPGPIGPLIVWLLKRGDHPFIDDQAKEALNFQLSVLIYQVAVVLLAALLMIPTIGLAILPGAAAVIVIGLLAIVFSVIGAFNASEGNRYRYPLTIRMIS